MEKNRISFEEIRLRTLENTKGVENLINKYKSFDETLNIISKTNKLK